MRKGKGDNEHSENYKKYLKTIFKVLIPSSGTIGIFGLINHIYGFIEPKLTVSAVCIIFICISIICSIALVVSHEIISYKKYKIYQQEQTKQIEVYYKYMTKFLKEKEKTKQAKIKKESNSEKEEAPYDCKIYEMHRMRKTN